MTTKFTVGLFSISEVPTEGEYRKFVERLFQDKTEQIEQKNQEILKQILVSIVKNRPESPPPNIQGTLIEWGSVSTTTFVDPLNQASADLSTGKYAVLAQVNNTGTRHQEATFLTDFNTLPFQGGPLPSMATAYVEWSFSWSNDGGDFPSFAHAHSQGWISFKIYDATNGSMTQIAEAPPNRLWYNDQGPFGGSSSSKAGVWAPVVNFDYVSEHQYAFEVSIWLDLDSGPSALAVANIEGTALVYFYLP